MCKLAIIGAGNMGGSILAGILKAGVMNAHDIIVTSHSKETSDRMNKIYGVATSLDNRQAVKDSQLIILAVKPNKIRGVLEDVVENIDGEKIVVSIAAAVSIEDMQKTIGDDKKIIRVMPNTPALVGQAMSAICHNKNVEKEDLEKVFSIFEAVGQAELIEETMMDAVIGVSGSSPAYVFMFIEAMADAAVMSGMPRKQAYKFAAQSVYGAAKMVLETGMHPGELKDMVCSPGGTTIAAVEVLEEFGLRNAVIKGQTACVQKSIDLSKK